MFNVFDNVNPKLEKIIRMLYDSCLVQQTTDHRDRRDSNSLLICMAIAYPNLDVEMPPPNSDSKFLAEYEPTAELMANTEDILNYLNDVSFSSVMKRSMNCFLIVLLAKEYKDRGISVTDYMNRIHTFFSKKDSSDYKKFVRLTIGWGKPNKMQARYKILKDALEELS
ncbi:hypothetical protein ACFVS2_26620 [Brevibacillus sp. NPDC058079]|uniref:hypothetical protein n=1 Tax=Brevibacillus sp. NPDC058079 TaxID=3346330 RepID=UPI0036E43410